MAYYEDLLLCDYFDYFAPGIEFVAVGWLTHNRPFSTGAVRQEVIERLINFLREPWDFSNFCGSHLCEICSPEGPNRKPGSTFPELEQFAQFPEIPDFGASNLFIPVKESKQIYAAPSLIAHYIKSHRYMPPAQFQEALLNCPDMNSSQYFDEMRIRGLGDWLESSR